MVSSQTISKLKRIYKEYLREENPNWSRSSVNTHCSDAFYMVNNEITSNFWECLRDRQSMAESYNDILHFLKEEVNSDHAEIRARGYFSDLKRLKEFLDRKFQGVRGFAGPEIDLERDIYELARAVYEGERSLTEGVEDLLSLYSGFTKTSYEVMISILMDLMTGKLFTKRINTIIINAYLLGIQKDYDLEVLETALKSVQKHILYYYEQTGNQSYNLCKQCQKIADEVMLNITFNEDMFQGIAVKKKESAWIFQGNSNQYNIIDYICERNEIIWDVKQYKNLMRKGDRVYIWISGLNGGVIASGVILSDPEIKMKLEDEYSLLEENYEEYLTVEIRIVRRAIDRPFTRKMMLGDERFKNLTILRYANATNYRLSTRQADLIDLYLNGEYQVVMDQSNEPEQQINTWIYAPGEKSCMWEEFNQCSIMGINWDRLGDLSIYDSKEAIRDRLKFDEYDTASHRNAVHTIWQFVHEVKIGDIVVVRRGLDKIIGRGIITSDYKYDPARDQYKSIRQVSWTHQGEWDYPGTAAIKTLTNLTPFTELVQKINEIFEVALETDEIRQEYPVYTKEQFSTEVFMGQQQQEILAGLLKYKKNIILEGAPGVGKTFLAKRLAYVQMGGRDSSRTAMVQFHQSYSYEDFICGYRPDGHGFKLAYGPFYEFCKNAEKDERDCYFIIDEINRGNLSKIFGELLMLIEPDKRGKENQLRLLYSNELFYVPENVHIIGMMNTADRSLAMIDYALRRRFAFYPMVPAFENDRFQAMIKLGNNNKLEKLIGVVRQLNECISCDETLGEGFVIGHSYFCNHGNVSDQWVKSIVDYELIPLLKEYWFDDLQKVKQWESQMNGIFNDKD